MRAAVRYFLVVICVLSVACAHGGDVGSPGRGHGADGRAAGTRHKKYRFDGSMRPLLKAVVLPWDAASMPLASGPRGSSRSCSVDEAVRGEGGSSRWSLRDQPTLVLLYDPSRAVDLLLCARLDDDPAFVAASYYFNLVKVDLRTTASSKGGRRRASRPRSRPGQLLVYDAAGKMTGRFTTSASAADVVRVLEGVIAAAYGSGQDKGSEAIEDMQDVLARNALLKNQLKLQEARLVDPRTGRIREAASQRLRRLRRELRTLETERRGLLVRRR